MASRDLSNFRTVTQVQPKLTGQGLMMAGEMGQQIIKISEQSRIAKSLSDAQLDLNKLDTEFRIQNESNPADAQAIEGYKKQRQGILNGYRGGIASIFVNDFDNKAMDLEANSDFQMQQWQFKQAQINIVTDIDEMAQNNKNLLATKAIEYAKTGQGDLDAILDFQQSRQQLIDFGLQSGAIGTESLNKVIAGYDQEMASSFLGVLASENPYRAKAVLDSGRFDSVLNVDDRLKINKSIDTGIKAARAEAAAYELTASLLNGERYAQPSSKQDRKIINNIYKQSGILQAFAQGNEEAVQETVGYIYETGIVPEVVQQTLLGQMTSNDPQAQQYAYSVIGKIQEAKPTALIGPAGFSEKEIRDAAAYNGMVRAGADSRFALDAVKRSNDPFQQDVVKMRETEVNSLLKDFSSDVIADDKAFGGGWFSSPRFMNNAVEAELMADYKTIYKQAYIKYGNEDAAKATALDAIKQTAQVSRVTGSDTLMKYAPEKFYSVTGLSEEQNQEWLRRDLASGLKTKGIEDLSRVSLLPSYDTPARVKKGLPPVYNVLIEDENGIIDNLRGENNMPLSIKFDVSKGIEKQKHVKERIKAQENIERELMENYEYRESAMTGAPVKVYKGGGTVNFPQKIYDSVRRKIKENEADRLLLTPEEQEEEYQRLQQIMRVL